ncbi:hypothetical protein HG531_011272 [Fusarium graminearum]|nr:hypothetical protein HG531_011272 [Fusarium graminearum]
MLMIHPNRFPNVQGAVLTPARRTEKHFDNCGQGESHDGCAVALVNLGPNSGKRNGSVTCESPGCSRGGDGDGDGAEECHDKNQDDERHGAGFAACDSVEDYRQDLAEWCLEENFQRRKSGADWNDLEIISGG